MKARRQGSTLKDVSFVFCLALIGLVLLVSVSEGKEQRNEDPHRADAGQNDDNFDDEEDLSDSVLFKPSLLTKTPVVQIPLTIEVALIGFTGKGNHGVTLTPSKLRELLLLAKHTHFVSSIEQHQFLPNIEFKLNYRVMHLPEKTLDDFESLIATALQGATGPIPTLKNQDKRIENFFSNLYASFNAKLVPWGYETYTIFIANPDLPRITKLSFRQIQGYRHAPYKSKIGSCCWIGAGRFAVIDVTSQSELFGSTDKGQVPLHPDNIPKVGSYMEEVNGEKKFMAAHYNAQIIKSITLLISNVILPDFQFDHSDPVSKILVPLIVFTDHPYDPFTGLLSADAVSNDPNLPAYKHLSINMRTIEREIIKIVPRGTQIRIASGVHRLGDHKHIATSVAKSMRTKIHHSLDDHGQFKAVGRKFLDGKLMIQELHSTADTLAKGMFENASNLTDLFLQGDLKVQSDKLKIHEFLKSQKKISDPDFTVGGFSASKSTSSDSSILSHSSSRELGLLILPIYVFSFIHQDPDLLLDDYTLSQATKDAVIVLQTANEEIPTQYLKGGKPFPINGSDTTRHIIAGLAMSQGLLPPYKTYSTIHNQVSSDLTWSIGSHPFSPTSNSDSISEIQTDAINRIAVLSRFNKAVQIIKQIVTEVDSFGSKYMNGSLSDEDEVEGSNLDVYVSWIDILHHREDQEDNPLLHLEVIDRLHDEIESIESKFHETLQLLRTNQLEQANEDSRSFIFNAKALRKYALSELAEAEKNLRCCSVKHTIKTQSTFAFILFSILALFAILIPIASVMVYVTYRKKTPSKSSRGSRLLN